MIMIQIRPNTPPKMKICSCKLTLIFSFNFLSLKILRKYVFQVSSLGVTHYWAGLFTRSIRKKSSTQVKFEETEHQWFDKILSRSFPLEKEMFLVLSHSNGKLIILKLHHCMKQQLSLISYHKVAPNVSQNNFKVSTQ